MDDTTSSGISCSTMPSVDAMERNVIIAIDVGSSSIRCTAYDCGNSSRLNDVNPMIQQQQPSYTVVASYSVPRKSIESYTGHVRIDIVTTSGTDADTDTTTTDNLFDTIDTCMDHLFQQLQYPASSDSSNNTTGSSKCTGSRCCHHVVAIGFTSFVMNLIGMDHQYRPIGNDCTMSYACQSVDVQDEVRQLVLLLQQPPPQPNEECSSSATTTTTTTTTRTSGINSTEQRRLTNFSTLYETMGVPPFHTAYALAQLRVWYRRHNNNNSNNNNSSNTEIKTTTVVVHCWQTIASICLHRWLGFSNETVLPISYSEASWMGLLNVHTGQYNTDILQQLLPVDCIKALPKIVNYDEFLVNGITTTSGCKPSNDNNNPYYTRWPLLFSQPQPTTTGTVTTSPPSTIIDYQQIVCNKFFFGIGDGACATIGSKCTTMNRIACTIGTSAAARVCIYYPIQEEQEDIADDDNGIPIPTTTNRVQCLKIPPGLFCYRIDRFHVLLGGALTDGGNVMEWIQNHLSFDIYKTTNNSDAMAATGSLSMSSTSSSSSEFQLAMHDAEQLLYREYNEYVTRQDNTTTTSKVSTTSRKTTTPMMVIPFFSGERNTGYRGNATGVLIGWTMQTQSHHIIKSCLEGITLRLCTIIQLICATVLPLIQLQRQEEEEHDPNRSDHENKRNDSRELSMKILCSGKALEMNPLWRTMIADCTGLPVYMEEHTNEGTSRGVAILLHHANVLQQQLGKPVNCLLTTPVSYPVEDLTKVNDRGSLLPSSSDVAMKSDCSIIIHPNLNVTGYWEALLQQQTAVIDALSPTLKWSSLE